MPEDGPRPPASPRGLVVREAQPADIDALAEIEADRFVSDRLSRRSLVRLSRSGSAGLLAAFSDGSAVGYVAILTRRGSQSARLYSIAVASWASGRGVGSHLLTAAEDKARARGARRVHLEVRADNAPAIAFYQRFGYQPIGRRPDYYEDGMAALLFARNISSSAASPSRLRRLKRAA